MCGLQVALPVYVPLAKVAGYDCACLPVHSGTDPPAADFRWTDEAPQGGSCPKGWEINGKTCRYHVDGAKVIVFVSALTLEFTVR